MSASSEHPVPDSVDVPAPEHPAAETPEAPSVFAPVPGFRGQQRFSDPAQAGVSTPLPAEWTAPTPPHGIPVSAPQTAQTPPQNSHQPMASGLPPLPPAPLTPPAAAAEQPPADFATPYEDLTTTALLGRRKSPPTAGWRRWLYLASFKQVNVGESPKVTHRQSLVSQVSHPLQGCYRIAVLSLKGGVGKTTITATLGSTFASIRGDRVIAVDANPDRGTLSQKVPLETAATVRHLLRDAEGIERYSDVRAYTSQGPSRLEVLASESDPAVSEAFSSEDYLRTLEVLERFYSLVLTDCGTGLIHSAMSAVLSKADVLIVVSSGSVDGARSARPPWTGSTRTAIRTWCAIRSRCSTRCARGQARWTCRRSSITFRGGAVRCGSCRSIRIWKRVPRSASTGSSRRHARLFWNWRPWWPVISGPTAPARSGEPIRQGRVGSPIRASDTRPITARAGGCCLRVRVSGGNPDRRLGR